MRFAFLRIMRSNGATHTFRSDFCGQASEKAENFFPYKHCFLLPVRSRYGRLSIYNLISFFRYEFPHIPRKISAYLRTELPSRANTRIMRGIYIILIINDLCLKGVSSHCKKHHFGMRNGLYWSAKWCFSSTEMGFIALRNGQYRKAELVFSDYDIGYMESRYTQKWPSIRRI